MTQELEVKASVALLRLTAKAKIDFLKTVKQAVVDEELTSAKGDELAKQTSNIVREAVENMDQVIVKQMLTEFMAKKLGLVFTEELMMVHKLGILNEAFLNKAISHCEAVLAKSNEENEAELSTAE